MSRKIKVFVVEDDDWFGRLINHSISLNPNCEAHRFGSAQELYSQLKEETPDIITLDYRLPDAKGAEVLEKVKGQYPETEVIIISEQQDIATAMELLHNGAYDYIVKDDNLKDRLLLNLNRLEKQLSLQNRIKDLEQELSTKKEHNFVGESDALKPIKKLVEKAAQSNITVTISGETGTGKEVIAQYIHQHSKVADKPMIAVNMAAIPENLLESELFGYEKGAFTGADKAKPGKFEEANGGTLFLDEVAELPLHLQSKLLRVLQERKLTRLGSNKEISFDCRIITATHKDLQKEVQEKRFREDLFFRLFGIQINLPPLRDRGEDIILLSEFFVLKASKQNGLPAKPLAREAKKKLKSYQWPGNIRELKAVMELALVLSNGEEIEAEDISLQNADLLQTQLQKEKSMRQYEIEIVQHYMKKYDDNTKKVAEVLSIGQTTVYRLLKEAEEKVA
ncbi:sigma-54-dependent transcriptional regulator [Luteibaculum oceani]|uniref:Sigma-54-dependent Fis family transcriptional regulator n=1 Tax=Luteibaculum oceani TaxID=1294296 RepID=A0A5C6V0Y0_9FLAO|nr:sigma-54 dependent transcriptional regulator [Luteibaculum oceani]TXC78604.1 sigma-54-dependent Fis family transcriptional regulator [Luteibaculum oceani]